MSDSIDPYSASYWQKQPSVLTTASSDADRTIAGLMQPPRVPLNAINRLTPSGNQPLKSQVANGKVTGNLLSSLGVTKPPLSHKKMIPEEDMEAFKNLVEGSDLTKVGLIELLKKRYV